MRRPVPTVLAVSLFVLGALFSRAAPAETVIVTRADCARIVAHVPAPDVAYRPGVDAEGNPVAPADLPEQPRLDIDPEAIAVEIDLPVRAFTGTPGDSGAFTGAGGAIDRFDATARIGVVTIENGIVRFDGQPLSAPDLERIAAACAAESRKRPE